MTMGTSIKADDMADQLLMQNDEGQIDLHKADKTKLAEMALDVIGEKIGAISVIQDWQDSVADASLAQLLKTRPFLEIFLMSLSSVLVGLFVIGSSKAYG